MSVLMTVSEVLGAWLFAGFPVACLVGAWFAHGDKNVEHDTARGVPCSAPARSGASNPGASGPASMPTHYGRTHR